MNSLSKQISIAEGAIKKLLVYDRALTSAEIMALYYEDVVSVIDSMGVEKFISEYGIDALEEWAASSQVVRDYLANPRSNQ